MTDVINDTKHDFWSNINWIKVNKIVNNLQCRIFVAKQQGNFRKLRKLQNLLLLSKANKLIAICQVCFKNSSNSSLIVNKQVYVISKKIMELVYQLYKVSLNKWKPTLIRSIYIKKSKGKSNFFEFQALIDYILQAIIRNALEPEWKDSLESFNSKFKQSNSTQNTIVYLNKLCNSISSKYWIVKTNIKNYFNNLSQKFLINQLSNFPAKGLIIKWLKSGYLDNFVSNDFFINTNNIISSLLVTIVLNIIEETIGIKKSKYKIKLTYTFIDYSNYFVVLCRTKKSAIEIKETINSYLQFKECSFYFNKAQIIYGNKAFNFLDFNLRLYKTNYSNKFLIKPSSESQIKIRRRLKTAWQKCLGLSFNNIVNEINLILKYWTNYYYKIVTYTNIFKKINYYNCIRQYRFAKRTHPKKSWKWIKTKYWDKLFFN